MTNVLIALDDSEQSQRAAEAATACFGRNSHYSAVYVEEYPPLAPGSRWGTGMYWGGVYVYPGMTVYPMATDSPERPADDARVKAEQLAADAGIDAQPIGGVGDPPSAIVRAAREVGADVIVVGAHQRNWFSRLFTGSTSEDVLARSPLPVMVVPELDED